MRAAALRDLVLVVRELQVDPAAVNVETLAQQRQRHGRAFDMPPRPPPAPGRLPPRLIVGGWLPQDEIHRILLVGCHLDPRAGDHVVDRPPRQLTVIGVGPHPEQHMALRRIGMAARDQILDHRDHAADMLGRLRLLEPRVLRIVHAQRRHVLMKPLRRGPRQLVDRDPALARAVDDLVLYIGDVAHIGHMPRPEEMLQQPIQHVEHHHRPRVAQMRPVIDGGAADIHPHVAGVDRFKDLLLAGLRVVQSEGRHGSSPRTSALARA